MVVDKFYDALPRQQPYLIDSTEGPNYDDLEEWDDYGLVRTNDLLTLWARGDPGATIKWHSHAPDFYQVLVTIKGRCRWTYKDNDGNERSVEAGPGETLFLPGGCENKVEVVSDEEHVHLTIAPRLSMSRMEYVVKEGGYQRKTDFSKHAALVYDNINDREVHVEKDAILNMDEIEQRKAAEGAKTDGSGSQAAEHESEATEHEE